jgi:hypothetical protein
MRTPRAVAGTVRLLLEVDYEDSLARELAERSLRSPHLMQLLCRELAKSQDITAKDARAGCATRASGSISGAPWPSSR